MAIIPKGKEPASIKKRLDILFPKLNQAYPDKKISGLYKDHKKWAETVTELYRALGYPDGTSFLEAYGYTVVINKGGRSKTIAHTQSDEFLKNIIRADSAVRTEALISKLSVTDFTPAAKSEVTAENIIWACCKGLSDEIVSVTEYLINENNYTYGYNDIIVSEDGVSEIFVYSDDVNKVIKKFPNIKVAAYSYDENSGKISVCYSESGYPMFTDKYETGYCDIKDKSAWVLQHTPYENLIIDGITYKFRNMSDWDELNYVFENSDGKSNQLGKG